MVEQSDVRAAIQEPAVDLFEAGFIDAETMQGGEVSVCGWMNGWRRREGRLGGDHRGHEL